MAKRSDEDALSFSSGSSKTLDIKEEYIEELDFCSPKFDPGLALKQEIVTVPSPDILTFDTVKRYEDSATRRRLIRDAEKSREQSVSNTSRSNKSERVRSSSKDISQFKEPLKSALSSYVQSSSSRSSHSRSQSCSTSSRQSTSATAAASIKLENESGEKRKRCRSRNYGPGNYTRSNSTGSREPTSNREPTEIRLKSSREASPKPKAKTHGDGDSQHGARENENLHMNREKRDHLGYDKRPPREETSFGRAKEGATFGRPKEGATFGRPRGDATPSTSKMRGGKEQRNIFTRMESMTGPLSFLTRCVKDKEHVRVMTRGAVTVNSICRGYIVAFDKYLNMAMIDVDEIYRRPKALGKVRARASHKLRDAQETLNKENKEYKARIWNISGKENSSAESMRKEDSKESEQKSSKNVIRSTAAGEGSSAPPTPENQPARAEKVCSRSGASFNKALRPNLRLLESVYPNLAAPMSPYEREALMLGIPDENIESRHVNQLLLRGENIVSISIIEQL